MTPGKTATIVSNGLNEASMTTTTTLTSDVFKTTTSAAMTESNSSNTENTTRNRNMTTSYDSVTIDTIEDKPMGTDCSSVQFKTQKSTEEKVKIESTEEGELLGSLVTMNSPAVRTSARVIQKMKQDSIRPTTPPLPDKKDPSSIAQKTPSQSRASKTTWTNVERNLFFEALNEYGKDFEAIAQYINVKQKRKNATDPTYKAKENVRQLYYQSYHKVSKYLRFSDDIKKNVQELYALINYGEIRKRVLFPNQKCFMKLRELVYKGWVSLRVKGKTYRIKTPSCKALRKINQVEEWQEDIKLPIKVDVILRPANSESWCKVQSLAQNPRIRTTLPLQKRLISLFKTLQVKWKSKEAKLIDQASVMIQNLNQQKPNTASTSIPSSSSTPATTVTPVTSVKPKSVKADDVIAARGIMRLTDLGDDKLAPDASATNSNTTPSTSTAINATQFQYSEPTLYILPHNETVIHRPMVNLTEFLSSHSICLNSYEERIGVTTRGETLCAERVSSFKDIVRTNAKRQRHDSGSEKKSPDMKRTRAESDSGKFDIINGKKSILRDHSNSKMSDDLSTTDEEKYDGDFMGGGTESVLFDIDGISQMVDSTSADEYEKDDLIKTEIKAEPIDDTMDASASVAKKESDMNMEPMLIVPDCIKHNLAKKNKKDAKGALATNKKRDIRKDSFRPLINEEVIKEIRRGWTADTVGDLTIGDLYIMFGQDSKVLLEYKWDDTFNETEIKTEPIKSVEPVVKRVSSLAPLVTVMDDSKETNSMQSLTNECDNKDIEEVKPKNLLTNKLKQLLLLATMTEKNKRKSTCPCGHYCDRGLNKTKKDEMLPRSYVSNKTYPASHIDNALFRQPVLPLRAGISPIEAYKLNLNNTRNKPNRWLKPRSNRASKQVVVQRLLPLQPGMAQTYGVVTSTNVKYNGNATNDNNVSRKSSSAKHIENGSSNSNAKSLLTSENLDRINARHHKNNINNNNNNSDNDNVNKTLNINELLDDEDNDDIDEDDEHETEQTGQLADDDDVVDGETSTTNEIDDVAARLNEDPGIQSLMEISLPSPMPIHAATDEYFPYNNGTPPMSPMGILQDSPSDPRWYEENLNDFSLSSFLGHLDASCDSNGKSARSPSRGVDSSNLSTISETSIDYITKFEELAESMKNDTTNLLMQ